MPLRMPNLKTFESLSFTFLNLQYIFICSVCKTNFCPRTFISLLFNRNWDCVCITGGLLHELSNEGARQQFDAFLEELLLPQMVQCAQVSVFLGVKFRAWRSFWGLGVLLIWKIKTFVSLVTNPQASAVSWLVDWSALYDKMINWNKFLIQAKFIERVIGWEWIQEFCILD